ncbi:MAG: hypothetical protein IJ642_06040 [Oscillospiraceae bacterium]|nr:hypothetical protein [Oscillospiraceae bacterium]MBR1528842.1 hypothetical protein [Oscillospiraceae bacterium]
MDVTVLLNTLIEIIKYEVESSIAFLMNIKFHWLNLDFSFWDFLLVVFVFDVIAVALFRSRGGDDD